MSTMKTILLATALVSLAAVTGCGSASRTPVQYTEDTQKAFAEQEAELKTCYDGVLATKADAKGDVTVSFYWTQDGDDDQRLPRKALEVRVGGPKADGEFNVVGDKTTAGPELTKCVTDSLAKARLKPAGKGVGQGTWTYHFAVGEAPSAAPAAAPAADAPKS